MLRLLVLSLFSHWNEWLSLYWLLRLFLFFLPIEWHISSPSTSTGRWLISPNRLYSGTSWTTWIIPKLTFSLVNQCPSHRQQFFNVFLSCYQHTFTGKPGVPQSWAVTPFYCLSVFLGMIILLDKNQLRNTQASTDTCHSVFRHYSSGMPFAKSFCLPSYACLIQLPLGSSYFQALGNAPPDIFPVINMCSSRKFQAFLARLVSCLWGVAGFLLPWALNTTPRWDYHNFYGYHRFVSTFSKCSRCIFPLFKWAVEQSE